ncbi:anti-sigma factor [Streptomyces sp. WMMC905]|uniref:anti-sigma factor n=1 Tax=Streptomyces sp. WMMC905 TaxID=3404123 RepID=UPI003B93CFFD
MNRHGDRVEPHIGTGAYALHALPEDERAEMERHLAACATCDRETRELQATAARLALATTTRPAPEVKERTMERVRHVRQDPPRATRHKGPHPLRRLAPLGLAAAVVLGTVSGAALWQHRQWRGDALRVERAEARAADLAEVLTAPDAAIGTRRTDDGVAGSVVVSRERDRAVFVSATLPPLGEGEVYQLWFADPDAMRPAGIMTDDERDGAVLLRGPIRAAAGVGLTVEPAGGSAAPTTEPILTLAFPT